MKFRVWDREKEQYIKESIYGPMVLLGQDGFLYEPDCDDGVVPLVPEWLVEQRITPGHEIYKWTQKRYEAYCKEHQAEWYTFEEQKGDRS